MFVVGATMVGAVGKFLILAFLEALKTKFNISIKAFLLCQKVGGMAHLPPSFIRGPCLFLYNISFLLIFLWK